MKGISSRYYPAHLWAMASGIAAQGWCVFDIVTDLARYPHQKSYGHFTPAHCRHLGLEEILGSILCSHHTDGETESSKFKSFAQDKPVELGLELLMPHQVKDLLSQCRSLRVGPAFPTLPGPAIKPASPHSCLDGISLPSCGLLPAAFFFRVLNRQ